MRSLFSKHMRDAASPDGMDTLLAELDDDEDGQIALGSLIRLLRREGAFEARSDSGLTEADVRSLLQPLQAAEDQISAVRLLRLIENRDFGTDNSNVSV